MDDDLSITFANVWIDIPEELVVRMVDVVNAVAHGHESLFLMAEAVHIIAALDGLTRGVVQSSHGEDEDD